MDNKSFLSVSDLSRLIKNMFDSEPSLSMVLVEGEITNFKNNSSGHLYFTLKDENAQINCVMFRSAAQYVSFRPKDGIKVYIQGQVSVYEKSGVYQIYVQKMKEQGIGDLYQKYEELKKKLESKGYFDSSFKKSLPLYPRSIALLTSATGAVIEDLKRTITERSKFSNLILYPTQVQGSDAKYSIVENIRKANIDDEVDVIILARGGGSIEDLWPFNEEIVADAIHASVKPIVSAIGHETDFTIADFTADLRVATPTAAALFVVLDSKDLKNSLDSLSIRMKNSYKSFVESKKDYLKRVLSLSIIERPDKLLLSLKQSLINLVNKLYLLSPANTLKKNGETLALLTQSLNKTYLAYVNTLKHSHIVINEKLALLNPMSILDKGYTITFKDGKIIKSIKEIAVNDEIETLFKDGSVISKIESKKE